MKNVGHRIAVSVGFQQVMSDATAVIDADLQDPLEIMPDTLALFHAWVLSFCVLS